MQHFSNNIISISVFYETKVFTHSFDTDTFDNNWNHIWTHVTCEELTHWKKPWCWEGLGAGGEGDNRGWDGWMA